MYKYFIYLLLIDGRRGGVVGGWTETKRMKKRETRLYMPFTSLITYTCQLSENSQRILPNKNNF